MLKKIKSFFMSLWKRAKALWWTLPLALSIMAVALFKRKERSVSAGVEPIRPWAQPVSIKETTKQRIDTVVDGAKTKIESITSQADFEKNKIEETKNESDTKTRIAKMADYLEKNL